MRVYTITAQYRRKLWAQICYVVVLTSVCVKEYVFIRCQTTIDKNRNIEMCDGYLCTYIYIYIYIYTYIT